MTLRAFVRRGDRTTHGGVVLTGDPTFFIHGQEVARVGDEVSCPRCKRVSRIVAGVPTAFSDAPLAVHDCITDCGAKLIASQSTDCYDDGSPAAVAADTLASMPDLRDTEEAAFAGPAPGLADADELRSVRFQAVDDDTGKPIAGRPYILTAEDGAQFGGRTDAQGYTQPIDATSPERVAVHFMFADSNGQTIDREELLP